MVGWCHVADGVTQFGGGEFGWVGDAVEPVLIVGEELAEFEVVMVCGGSADDGAVLEVGEGGNGESGDDVMCFGFVADGDADFV